MGATLDNLAEAIEQARQENRADFKDVKGTQAEHGERLAKVEQWKDGHGKAHWGLIGAIAAAVGVVSGVVAFIGG
jgi:hypothetical protein